MKDFLQAGETETKYRDFFDHNPISIWMEDFTLLHHQLQLLSAQYGPGLKQFLLAHPEEVYRLMDLVIVNEINQATLKMFEAASEQDLLAGIRLVFPGEALPVYIDEIEAFLNEEEFYEAEFPMKTLKGRSIICLVRIKLPLNGSYTSVMVSRMDITVQKKAEQAIKESEQQFRAIFDNAAVGVAQVATNGQWLRVNKKLCDIVGYTEEELTSLSFQDITHPDDLQTDVEFMYQLVDGNINQFATEKRYLKKDGSATWINLTSSVIRNQDGSPRFFISVIEDINERKEIERSLQKSEQRFRALVTASSDLIYRMNADWSELQELHGRAFLSDAKGPTTNWMEKYIPPGEWTEVKNKIDAARLSKTIYEHEHRVIKADGTIGWLFSRAVPIQDAKGEIIEWFGAASDVTEHYKMLDELKASEQEFRTMANSIQNLAWIADENGWIYWYNQRWYEYTGTTLKEMEGWGWRKVHHPDHIGRIVDFVREAWLKSEPFELTFPLRRHDGEYRWFLTRAFPIKNEEGKVYKWIGTNTDVQEQVEREREMKLAKEQLELTFANVPSGIYLFDKNGRFLYLNEMGAHQLGFSSADVMLSEKNIYNLRKRLEALFEITDGRGNVVKDFASAITLRTKKEEEVLARYVHKQTGVVKWLRSRSTPLFDETGEIEMLLTTSTDVTAEQTFTEKLEREVDQRTRELQRSNEELQRFAHIASHDLKEPVRKIKTFTGWVEEDLKDHLTDRTRMSLERIYNATDRMYSLIDGILNYSGIDAEKETFSMVDLNTILQGVEQDLEIALHQRKGSIVKDELPVVEGVEILLRQLFYNLVNNSIKFSKNDSSLTITISYFIFKKDNKEWTQISIHDNGIGFEQHQAEKIFQIYARLHSRHAYEGTGIGLALCKKIVEKHRGFIWAKSVPGDGATFFVELPLRQGKSVK
jgi:PAS domain S-box-containing protein